MDIAHLHFLVAQADPAQRRALVDLLGQLGASRVTDVADGHLALQMLEAGLAPAVNVAIVDLALPGMDGLEATRRIRADGRFDRLPIIAITAKAMKDDQEQCLQAGANDYLAKPIDLSRLYSLLRVWMPTMERI